MKFNIINEHSELQKNTCIITGIFEQSYLFPTTKKINVISKGYIDSLLHRGIITGKMGKIFVLYDIPHIFNQITVLVGCGKKNTFDAHHYRTIINKTIEILKDIPIIKISFFLSELNILGYNNYWKIRQTIELIHKKLYFFDQFKNKKNFSYHLLDEISLCISKEDEEPNHKNAIKDGSIISKNIKIAKDLGNMPPNICTPTYLVNKVKQLSNHFSNVNIEIIDDIKMKKLGMNAYLAVGQGAHHPSIMPIIKYQGHPNGPIQPPIVLIGKGVTFDSGGISIKHSENMDEMKYDMCGAAAVYAVMRTAMQLALPLNIIGILAICENMISSTSLRPGDILTTLSGKTIEVLNTDAEGRLVLCDILTYVERYKPKIVIDIATLTGACVVALGHHFTGLMTNNDNLAKELITASQQTQDYIWKLPMCDLFHKQLESNCADMTNIGGSDGSAITAGCFLSKFAYKYNWAHLDIAGTAWTANRHKKNATGRPVSLLSQFLINYNNNNINYDKYIDC